MLKEMLDFRRKLRTALAEYIQSEGCSCCENIDKHEKDLETLAKLLNVPKYDDGSGYNFSKFANCEVSEE